MTTQEGTIQRKTKTICRDNCCSGSGDNHSADEQTVPGAHTIQGSLSAHGDHPPTRWRKIRAGLLLGVGCLTSPCCSPLIVPAVLALLAGTPLAVFLAQYIGWVYAALTLVSLLSLFFGVRALWAKQSAQSKEVAVSAPGPASSKGSQISPAKMDARA